MLELTDEQREELSKLSLDDVLPFGQNGHWGSDESGECVCRRLRVCCTCSDKPLKDGVQQ